MVFMLFVTDLDNTLVGEKSALIELNQQLKICRDTYGTRLVYTTGRSLSLYRQLALEQELLTPDALVVAVGTEIYGESDTLDLSWSQYLMQRRVRGKKWDRNKVEAIASQFTNLWPQPDSEQRPFKISYFLADQLASTVILQLKDALFAQGIEVEIIYSGGRDLDILPYGIGKGKAMNFLQSCWRIDSHQTIVCGDSGNDLSLFCSGLERGIIVANAQPELLDWHAQNPASYRYLAQSNCASGILEGFRYFGVWGS